MRSIEQTLTEFYECMSFNAGEEPNPEKLKELFFGEGVLINNHGDEPMKVNVEGFIRAFRENIKKGIFPSLQGREISHKMDMFGKIAQRFSVYEFRYGSHVSLGINTIQFIEIKDKWYIISAAWMDQNESLKIPEEYLQNVRG
jgi:hypothetical protein